MTPTPLSLPTDLEPHADAIHACDPRFSAFLAKGATLRQALDGGQLTQVQVDAVAALARTLADSTVETVMANLIDMAYVAALGKAPSPKWSAGLSARYGVQGPPVTLQVAGDIVGVTRERVRQVGARVEPHLRGAWVPQLRPILELLVAQSPVADPIGVLLADGGLSEADLAADSLLTFVDLLGADLPALVGTEVKLVGGWLVDVREEALTAATRIASKHTSTFGMTTVEDVRQELSTPGNLAGIEDVRRVLEGDPRVGWSGQWLWVNKPNDNQFANSMVNTVRSILSVNSPQSVDSLQEGLRRQWKFRKRDIVPPVEAMVDFLQASPYFTVTDGLVESVEPLDYHNVQGEVASAMIDVLKASPYQVMDRASLTEACTGAGISAATSGIWTTYSEWMEQVGWNVWGLRGSNPNPGVVEEVKRAAKARHRSEAHATRWSWSADGGIVLTMDVSTSARNSGTFGFDAALGGVLGSRRFTMLADGKQVGEVRTSGSHWWTWGWGKAFSATGAKVGDVLHATLDLAAETATIRKGGRELWG